MGIECDQEIVQMIGSEEEVLICIAPCLEECHRAQVFSQNQVIQNVFTCTNTINRNIDWLKNL